MMIATEWMPFIQNRQSPSLHYRLSVAVTLMMTLALTVLFPQAKGLRCYECLALDCPSAAICHSIKKTMNRTFVPKRHIIEFSPYDPCPPKNVEDSSQWQQLSRQCDRADSVCLVTALSVWTKFDGSLKGKPLEEELVQTTGYIRGCASRRILKQFDDKIKVEVSNSTAIRLSLQGHKDNGQKMDKVYEMEEDSTLSQMRFDDGYVVDKIHSHFFSIDQGTENATKCYEDNCNVQVKISKSSASWICVQSPLLLLYSVSLVIILADLIF